MKTKEAIKFLRNHFKIGIYEKISKEIIILIKQLDKKSIRGEKYENMWKVFEKLDYGYFNNWESRCIRFKMDEFKQKYFPKEK